VVRSWPAYDGTIIEPRSRQRRPTRMKLARRYVEILRGRQ